jgi:uncharacterized protein
MEYAAGKAGRIFAMRLFEGEDVYECIEKGARIENIKNGSVFITGGIRKADVVVGPKREKPSLEGWFRQFTGPGEVLGVGTLYWDDQGPKLHLHAAMGRGESYIVGCPRGGAEVFLILEVTIIEITGIKAARIKDPQSGVNLLRIEESR